MESLSQEEEEEEEEEEELTAVITASTGAALVKTYDHKSPRFYWNVIH